MWNYIREYFDYRTFLIVAALTAIGLLSIYSATYDARASEIFSRQLLWVGVGVFALLVAMLLPYRLLQFLSVPSYALSIALLVAVLVTGKTVSGSTSWFNLGTLRLQPSEFAKITTALALASYLSRSDISLRRVNNLAVAGGIVLLPVVLIMLQPDFGTALIYIGMFFPVLYWAGASRFTILSLLAPGVVALAALFGTTAFLLAVLAFGVLLYITKENRVIAALVFSAMVLIGISVQFIYDGLKPYQQKRIAAFLDPAVDPRGAGYNILQSKVAIGSGGLLGKGFLRGTQTQLNFIPEQWTDFIFCVPAEEFGFLGAGTVLLLLILLLLRTVSVASAAKSSYAGILAIAIGGILASHIVINVGMSLGLLPVIGVPLPFLSYGGSSLLANMIMAGILLNLYAHRKEY
jgi:rod shape determining protein RodA